MIKDYQLSNMHRMLADVDAVQEARNSAAENLKIDWEWRWQKWYCVTSCKLLSLQSPWWFQDGGDAKGFLFTYTAKGCLFLRW